MIKIARKAFDFRRIVLNPHYSFAHKKKPNSKIDRLTSYYSKSIESLSQTYKATYENYLKAKDHNKSQKKSNQEKTEYKFDLNPRYIAMVLLIGYFLSEFANEEGIEGATIDQIEFMKKLERKQFTTIKIVRKYVKNKWTTFLVGTNQVYSNSAKIENVQETLGILSKLNTPLEFEHIGTSGVLLNSGSFGYAAGILLGIGVLYFVLRIKKNGISTENLIPQLKSNVAKPTSIKTDIKFKDVAGLKEAKVEITEFVQFLKSPQKFIELGARTPKGALLTGPPGTGKTMLAKACSGESGVPFFYVSGSDFVEKYVGVGAARIRSLFQAANKQAPSIIFIDQIDAIGKKRSSGPRGNQERDNTLNQLLVNMDGFGSNSKVIIMAATNRKDLLDAALLRPGRFDRLIEITLPDLEGRIQILEVHLTNITINPNTPKSQFSRKIAAMTPGLSGADLRNVCNQAAILAARLNQQFVQISNFQKATERVQTGLQKNNSMTLEERKKIAYHQAGHALVAWFLEGGDPVVKLTILPRSKSVLGHSQTLPDQSSLYTREILEDKICCAMAGRLSEQIVFSQITNNGADDIKKVRRIADAIVSKYGMTEEISNIGFPDAEFIKKPYSDFMQEMIDTQTHKIIGACKVRTQKFLRDRLDTLVKLAQKLFEKQTLTSQQIVQILGQRPFKAKSNYKAYLETN